MVYLLIPLILVVAAALAWSWWSGHEVRDPTSSIDSFHRALEAMQPHSARVRSPEPAWEQARPADRPEARSDEIVRASR